MRITSKGQVTIPAEIREKAGLLPDTEVEFGYDGKVVTLVLARGKSTGRGRRLVDHLRRNPGDIRMSTDEILALTRGEP
jgi:AbrB family looped-hinge helix DNA binding protein